MRARLLGSVLVSILGCGCSMSVAPVTGSAAGGGQGAVAGAAGAAQVVPVVQQQTAGASAAGANARSSTDRDSGSAGRTETAAAGAPDSNTAESAGAAGVRSSQSGAAGTGSSQSDAAGVRPSQSGAAGTRSRPADDAAVGAAGGTADAGAADAGAAGSSAAGSPAAGAAGSPSDPDDATQWILDNGFGSFLFAVECVSLAPDGSIVEGEPLPVGAGYRLQCETASSASESTTEFSNDSDERYCVLGILSEAYGESSHPCLKRIEITSAPDAGPWTLVASGDEACQISRAASAFGKTWPLWVNASYDTAKIVPAIDGSTCDELFGL